MVLTVRRLLTAALDRVGRNARAAATLSAVLESVGAQTLADRVDRRRSGGGIEPIVLPVGPNTGFYSLVAVTANRALTVHAFEPARDVFPLLERNVALCPQRTHVTMT